MMAKANAVKQCTIEAATAPVNEDDQDHADTVNATEGAGIAQKASCHPSSALQEEAQDFGDVDQTTREKSAVKSGEVGEDVPRRNDTLQRVGEGQVVGSEPSTP